MPIFIISSDLLPAWKTGTKTVSLGKYFDQIKLQYSSLSGLFNEYS
jgi:hypothetical protein